MKGSLVFVALVGAMLSFGWASGWWQGDANASSPAIATVVGVEKHSNPYGDRWIEIQPYSVPHVGLWVSEACALTLRPGDDWPSADAACR